MTIFVGACCVASCPFNLGNGRVTCDWLRGGRGVCHHPTFREAWALAHELEQAQEAEAEPAPILTATATVRTLVAGCAKMHDLPAKPSSMTSRVAAANVPVSSARARQLVMAFVENTALEGDAGSNTLKGTKVSRGEA